jgi:hypothetical protein
VALDSECDIIAHPQIDNTNVEQFIDCPKVLEINSKHRLSFEILDKLILDTSNIFSLGSDTHDLNDFVVAQDFFTTVLKKYPKIRLFNRKNVS